MKIAVRSLVALIVVGALAGAGVYLVLQPPEPLALPSRGLTLADVTLVNPGGERLSNRRVVVEGSEIAAIGEPDPGETDAFSGMFVLPGLTDMHVHFPPSALPGQSELFAFLFLYHGITTVRDAGDVDGTASEPARSGIAAERFPGPRVFSCGPFVDGADPLWGNSLVAIDADQGREAVETIAAGGWDCVKAYNGLDAETLAAIRATAAELDLPVIGHVPAAVPYEDARLDDAQHGIGIPPPLDPPAPYPFILKGWNALGDERLAAIVELSVRLGIANTPTLVTTDRLLASEDLERVLTEPDVGLLPRFYREVVWSPAGGTSVASQLSEQDFEEIRSAFEVMKRSAVALVRGGAQVHTGTDALVAFVVPGASLHRELRILVAAGLSPEEALELSTRRSASFLDATLGSVRVGGAAELVIYREDPTQSLDALDSIVGVVRDGRLFTREALDAQLASYREHYDGALYDAIVTPLVRRVLAATRGE